MKELIARGNRQLGECMRLLASYKIISLVDGEINPKGRIVFRIQFYASDELYKEIKMRYEYMIS